MSSDDTVIVRPKRRGGRYAGAIGGLGLLAVAVAGGFWFLQHDEVAPAVAIVEPIPLASEAAIRQQSPAVQTVLRFEDNPAVVVIDFPTLDAQGRMLNRLAAWAEKAGVAHDRIPNEAVIEAAIAASGVTAATYYYGHDYSGGAVRDFFAEAEQQHVALRPEEEALRRIVARATGEAAGFGAVITVTRADAESGVTPQARATILHHELSHGEYFTNPAYAAFVASFWQTVLTAPERAAVRTYLASEGYDPALEDLMRNEMQAYLIHTPDPAFFQPDRLGLTPARLAELRRVFLAGMPDGWLRQSLQASGTVPQGLPAAGSTPARRPRRTQRSGRVSIGTADTETAPPRRRRVSTAFWTAAR